MRTLALLSIVALPACLGGGYQGSAADTADTAGADQDAASQSDLRPPICEVTGVQIAGGGLRETNTPWYLAAPTGDLIYFSGNPWEDLEEPSSSRLDPDTGAVSDSDLSGDRVRLVDGRAGALLYTRGAGPSEQGQDLVYRDADGEVLLATTDVGEIIWFDPPYAINAPRQVGHQRAAWFGCARRAGWRCEQIALYGWWGGEVKTLWAQPDAHPDARPSPPEVDAQWVIWAEPVAEGDGRYQIREWRGGEPRVLFEHERPVRRVVRAGSTLLWSAEDGIWSLHDGASEPTVGANGSCGALQSDGQSAVFICTEDDAGSPEMPMGITESQSILWLQSGGEKMAVQMSGEGVIVAPRVAGDLIAWLLYPKTTDGCTTDGPGQVMVAPVARPEASVSLGEIGVSCYCCESIWPDQQLVVTAGTVAWNYAAPDPDLPFGGRDEGALGWARVETREACY